MKDKEISPKSLVLIASPNALMPNIESLLFYHGYNGRKIKQVFIYCTNHKAMSGIPALKLKRIVKLFDKKITIELHDPSENDDGSSPEALTNAIISWQRKINTKNLIINANGGNKLHFLAAINLINSRPGISVCYKEVEAGWLAFSSHYENNICTVKTKGFSIDQKMMNTGLKEIGLRGFLGEDERAKMFEPNMIVEGDCVNLLEKVKIEKWDWNILYGNTGISSFSHWFCSCILAFDCDDVIFSHYSLEDVSFSELSLWILNNGEFYYFNVSSNYDNNLSEKIEKSKNRTKALFGLKCHIRFIRPAFRVSNKKKLDDNLSEILILQNSMGSLFSKINEMLGSRSQDCKQLIEWENSFFKNEKLYVNEIKEAPIELLDVVHLQSLSKIARFYGYPDNALIECLIEDKVIHRGGTNPKLSINSSLVDAELRNTDRGEEYIVYNSEKLKNRYKIEDFLALPSRKFKTIKNEADKKLSKFNGAYLNMVQQELERGTAILTSEEQLNWYVKSYAVKHQQRIKAIYKMLGTKINLKQVFGNPFSIVDYACGQGLSTLFTFESLSELIGNYQCSSLTLIEPSINALHKAKYNFRGNVIDVNKKLSELSLSDIQTPQERLTLHLFMNILDMSSIKNDIEQLSKLIVNSVKGNNIFICVSPYNFSQIKAFYDCINDNPFNKLDRKIICEANRNKVSKNGGLDIAALVFEVNENGSI